MRYKQALAVLAILLLLVLAFRPRSTIAPNVTKAGDIFTGGITGNNYNIGSPTINVDASSHPGSLTIRMDSPDYIPPGLGDYYFNLPSRGATTEYNVNLGALNPKESDPFDWMNTTNGLCNCDAYGAENFVIETIKYLFVPDGFANRPIVNSVVAPTSSPYKFKVGADGGIYAKPKTTPIIQGFANAAANRLGFSNIWGG